MASGVIVERKVVVKGRLSAYFALTKPRIIELLLITTVPSMVIAAGGWPGTWLVLTTLIGGTMSRRRQCS